MNLASRSNAGRKLPSGLRRITVRRDTGERFDIISNDKTRSARDLAACYKARWQIELFFKWIKQNLNIGKFIAMNENAIRLQILSAMIAFVLLQCARQAARLKLTPRRFAELVSAFIHVRRDIATIDKPPPINPSKPKSNKKQLEFNYA